MKLKTKSKLAALIAILSFPIASIIVSQTNLGEKIFHPSKAEARRSIELASLYELPEKYFTSEGNLENLFHLAGYDAGTVGQKKGYFDPNTQREELTSTCKRIDVDSNKIISPDEIKNALKRDYNWNPISLK